MATNIFKKYLNKDYKSDYFGTKKGKLRRALKKKAQNEFNRNFKL